jgi:hypothetical protein
LGIFHNSLISISSSNSPEFREWKMGEVIDVVGLAKCGCGATTPFMTSMIIMLAH